GTGTVSLRRGRFKYIFAPGRAPGAPAPARGDEAILPAEARYELYDLGTDPGETKSLTASRPELARQLRADVQDWFAEQHRRGEAARRRIGGVADHPRPPDPLLEGQLRALGYVN